MTIDTAATCAVPDGPSHPCAGAGCDHQDCHAGWFARNPRADGLVYCCSREGWVTPADAFDHSWDPYSDL